MAHFPYQEYDAVGLAGLVQKKKEVTAEEIVAEAVERLERLNPKINAVIHTMYEKAKAAAAEITGEEPFAGVPMLLKDIAQECKGEPITYGSKAFQGYRAQRGRHFCKAPAVYRSYIFGGYQRS